MLDRRELLTGLGCVAALGTAEALRPRRRISFMPAGGKLTDLLPRKFPGFSEGGGGDVIQPRTEGTLSAALYSDLLTRTYRPDGRSEPEIMMLIAYGPAQTDMLQLHRPEICYPALGFEIAARETIMLACGAAGAIPAVALTAVQGGRVEDIIYWSRIGQALPRDFAEQSWARLQQSIAGDISDGTLVRASAIRIGPDSQFGPIRAFLEALVPAVRPAVRPVLIGR